MRYRLLTTEKYIHLTVNLYISTFTFVSYKIYIHKLTQNSKHSHFCKYYFTIHLWSVSLEPSYTSLHRSSSTFVHSALPYSSLPVFCGIRQFSGGPTITSSAETDTDNKPMLLHYAMGAASIKSNAQFIAILCTSLWLQHTVWQCVNLGQLLQHDACTMQLSVMHPNSYSSECQVQLICSPICDMAWLLAKKHLDTCSSLRYKCTTEREHRRKQHTCMA